MTCRRHTSTIASIVLAPVLAGLSVGCGSSRPAVATASAAAQRAGIPAGRIAFRRYLDEAQTQSALFTIGTDGSHEQQLTHPPAGTTDDQPDWSPDGKLIAFEGCSDAAGCQAYTVAAAGGPLHRVHVRCWAGDACDVSAPAWTSDGRLVVVLAQGRERTNGGERQIQQSSLELLDLARGTQRTILQRTHWAGDFVAPAISADGRTVLYTHLNSWLTNPADAASLYTVGIDGSANRRITPWKLGGGDHPTFARDGTILFRSYEDQENKQSQFMTVKPDGTGLRQLTHFPDGTPILSASYSADGRWIVYARGGASGNADLYVMRADGTRSRPLMRTSAWDSAPDWGPGR
jgi:Tol biopolymer transport system component